MPHYQAAISLRRTHVETKQVETRWKERSGEGARGIKHVQEDGMVGMRRPERNKDLDI